MAFGGIPQDDEGGWVKFIVFEDEDEAKNLDKFLSSHKPSDPSWNKYVIFRIGLPLLCPNLHFLIQMYSVASFMANINV